MPLIVDLFAGPGGWSEALHLLGHRDVGIEWDQAACLTRSAAGHLTIRADVATYPTAPFVGRVDGLIASPPCPDFSRAGKRAGLNGKSGPLVFEVMRWASALKPRWVACEQVPDVLPIWRMFAAQLRDLGYSAWAGLLSSERYGVPQTRERAILIARRDGVLAAPPEPTHREYVKDQPRHAEDDLFGPGLLPWVSMADALGWTGEGVDRPARTVCGDRGPRWMYPSNGSTGDVVLRNGNQQNACVRDADEPAGTIFFGHAVNDVRWVRTSANSEQGGGRLERYERSVDAPAPTVMKTGSWTLHTNRGQQPDGTRQTRPADQPAPALTGKSGGQWAFQRPATTIQGDPRVWPPGHKVNGEDLRRDATADQWYGDRAGTDSVKITVQEAGILQSFRPDYPWQGNKSKQHEQVGNAIPPLFAAAILKPLLRAAERAA